jgi:uncharacterized membrane protein
MADKRDRVIDILRGLAVVCMVLANFSSYVIDNPHFGLRFIYSIVAPIFILLSNFMIAYNYYIKKYNYSYYLKRGLYLIFWGVFIDTIVHRNFPFASFDVLYLIGFSIILNSLFFKINSFVILIIANIVFVLTYYFQSILGYIDIPKEASLFNFEEFKEVLSNYSIKQFFIDGWFPVFPFEGIALMGLFYFWLYKNKKDIFLNKYFIFINFIVFVILSFILYKISGSLYIREASCKLFYPPTLVFIYWSLSFINLLFSFLIFLSNKNVDNYLFHILAVLGRNLLFIYIVNSIFGEYVVKNLMNLYKLPSNYFVLFSFWIIFVIGMFIFLEYKRMIVFFKYKNKLIIRQKFNKV